MQIDHVSDSSFFGRADSDEWRKIPADKKMKILLLIKDNDYLKRMMEKIFRKLNIEYVSVLDFNSAKTVFNGKRFDVIFIDCREASTSSTTLNLSCPFCCVLHTSQNFEEPFHIPTITQWFINSPNRPPTMVAIDRRNGTSLTSLFNMGFNRCFRENNDEEMMTEEILHIQYNDFKWGLYRKFMRAFQVAVEKSNQCIEITDASFVIKFANDVSYFKTSSGEIHPKQKTNEITSDKADCDGGRHSSYVELVSKTINIIPVPNECSPDYYVFLQPRIRGLLSKSNLSMDDYVDTICSRLAHLLKSVPIINLDEDLRNDVEDALNILQSMPSNAERRRTTKPRLSLNPAANELMEGLVGMQARRIPTAESRNSSIPALDNKNSVLIVKSSNSKIKWADNISVKNLYQWEFNIFEIEEKSRNHTLQVIAWSIFHDFQMNQILQVAPNIFYNWLILIEKHYYPDNSYHNATHAADVLQSACYLIRTIAETSFTKNVKRSSSATTSDDIDNIPSSLLSRMDIVSIIIACIIHDVEHPGRTNPFLVNSYHQLAVIYNDMSVLENHHLTTFFTITKNDPEVNIFKELSKHDFVALRSNIIDMVMATDMSKHFSAISDFQTLLDHGRCILAPSIELRRSSECLDDTQDIMEDDSQEHLRASIRRMIIKCSDISNPAREFSISKTWAQRISKEYYLQAQDEISKDLPVAMPMFAFNSDVIPLSQVTFMELFVIDAFSTWDSFCPVPTIMTNLKSNIDKWKSMDSSFDMKTTDD